MRERRCIHNPVQRTVRRPNALWLAIKPQPRNCRRCHSRPVSETIPKKFYPFLFRSLKNSIYNQLIRNARTAELDIENIEFTLSYTIEENLFSKGEYSLTDEVKNIMESLTERQKEIVYLRFIHDMTIDEIAQIMDMNTQSARNLISRSLQKLRESSSKVSMIILP